MKTVQRHNARPTEQVENLKNIFYTRSFGRGTTEQRQDDSLPH
jgi:hypothetical protein